MILSRIWVLAGAFAVLLLDQGVKAYVQTHLLPMQPISLWPGVFQFTLVYNTGAAFSMFEQYPSALLMLTIALFVVLLFFALRRPFLDRASAVSYALILGGALGNISDRAMLGKVVDYLDFVLIHYPVFNLADACIFVGVLFLMIRQFKTPARQQQVKER